ncbi:MAG TPA: hypothetical protein VFF38_02030 [Microvirga sp.]|nr:hypothetical protein [Microvirga sp.]
MNMSDMANKLKYDITDTLKKVTGKLSFWGSGRDRRDTDAGTRSGTKK